MRPVFLSIAAACVVGFTAFGASADGDLPPLANPGQPPTAQPGQTVIIVQQGNGEGPLAPSKKPKRIPVVDGEDPPAGYHSETTTIKGLWIAGIATWGAGYLITLLSGAVNTAVEDDSKYAYEGLIPGAGPWILFGQNIHNGSAPWYVFCGVLQTAGIGMTIGGLAGHKEVWNRDEASLHRPLEPELLVGPGNLGLRMRF